MIASTAATNRILLREPQAGKRLARIEDSAIVSGNGLHVCRSYGGRRRQGLQQIQRRTFAAEDRTGRTMQTTYSSVGLGRLAIIELPIKNDPWVYLAIHLIDPGTARHGHPVTCDYCGIDRRGRRDQFGRQIAITDVFTYHACNGCPDVC